MVQNEKKVFVSKKYHILVSSGAKTNEEKEKSNKWDFQKEA